MRVVTPGKIDSVTGEELSAVLAECAARTEIARAGVEEARRKQEEAVAKHEAVTVEQKALTTKLDEQRAEADARWDDYRRESARKTDAILAELREARDERRALIEALFRVMDQLD